MRDYKQLVPLLGLTDDAHGNHVRALCQKLVKPFTAEYDAMCERMTQLLHEMLPEEREKVLAAAEMLHYTSCTLLEAWTIAVLSKLPRRESVD